MKFKLSGDFSSISSDIHDATSQVKSWIVEMMAIEETRVDGLSLTPGKSFW